MSNDEQRTADRGVLALFLATAMIALLSIPVAASLTVVAEARTIRSTASTSPHVMVIMEENRGYASITAAAAPYLESLATTYASGNNWWGVAHPSEPNYLAITTGGTQGCSSDSCFKTLTVPSVGGQLTAAGIPWVAYMESMPSPCYTKPWFDGTGSAALYGEKHDPFVVVSDVLDNNCKAHVLPYPGATAFATALTSSGAPDFVWITPNQQDDMHTGSVTKGDTWAKANIAPIIASSWFTGFNSTIVFTMDEGQGKTGCCGGAAGGQVIEIIVSNNAKGVGTFSTAGDDYGTLLTIETAFGLAPLGSAKSASSLTRFFG